MLMLDQLGSIWSHGLWAMVAIFCTALLCATIAATALGVTFGLLGLIWTKQLVVWAAPLVFDAW